MAASETTGPFTIDNLPYGVISTEDNATPRCAVAFGGSAIDVGLFSRGDLDDSIFANVSTGNPQLCSSNSHKQGQLERIRSTAI